MNRRQLLRSLFHLLFAVVVMITALSAVLLRSASRAAADGEPLQIPGFKNADATLEKAREAQVVAVFRPDTLRKNLRILTEEPHVAGTPADRADAEFVRDRLAAWGWDARIEAVPVWLNYPLESKLELVEPSNERLAVREKGVAWDKDAFSDAAFDAFHGYGASGDITAQVIYANYGDVDDFKKLAELGVDVHGKIVLVRYGKNFRGLKVRNAERAGAAGVVIYSDPADDGYAKADAYPRGAGRPDDAIQRGSVQFLSEGPGDPTTPGWASTPNGKRLKPSEARGIPHIPSIPLSWGEAQKILGAIEGPQSPAAWQGALPLTYHVGPGPAKLHLKMVMDYKVRDIWNVIATLKGRELPDQWVLCGNHRDAWTYGAIDPNSGTICLLEMARGIGQLLKTGWRPRRTLMLCSWDGEEYGLLGSTEWCEANGEALQKNAVAYVNVDVAVAGKDFRVNGCHALRDILWSAMGEVKDPGKGESVLKASNDKAFSEGKVEWARQNRARRWRGEPERPFETNLSPLGSGSDYTAFVDRFGVPALDLRFEGLQGTYHSMYDDFEYLDRVIDPDYTYHVAMTEVWSRLALRLAEAQLLPLEYSNTGQFALDELQAIEERMDDANAGKPDSVKLTLDLKPLRTAATRLRDSARMLETRATQALYGMGAKFPGGSVAATNAVLMSAERALLGSGLPGRPWFRHELYAPGLNTGYASTPLPRLAQPILDSDPKALAAGAAPVRAALERAAQVFEALK